MTVSAQNPQISLVCLPIFEASGPRVMTAFGANFCAGVNVIDVQRSNVREAAAFALSSETGDQLKFLAPVVRVLRGAVSIPPRLLAVRVAELCAALRAALATVSGAAPPSLKVTGLAAIFARPVFDPIGVHQGDSAAMLAGDFDFGASHAESLSKFACAANPGYFEIACKRIEEAWKQPRLFEEPKRKPEPAPNLFDGAAQ